MAQHVGMALDSGHKSGELVCSHPVQAEVEGGREGGVGLSVEP